MKTKRTHCCRKAFTLIELLAVIAVIVILAGITAFAVTGVARSVAVRKAHIQMELLDGALHQYRADTGQFPSARDGTGMAMYCVLFGDGVGRDGIRGTADDGPLDGKRDAGAKTYLEELNPATNPIGLVESSAGGVPTRLVDPFGNSWTYVGGDENAAVMNNKQFDIHSPGPDREGTPTDPGADDIRNW